MCAWIGRDRVDIGKDERACDVAVRSPRRARSMRWVLSGNWSSSSWLSVLLVGLQLTHRATQCHCTPLGEQTVCWSSCGCDRMRLTWTRITLRRVSMMGFKKFSVPRHCHYDMRWRCGVGRAHAGVFASGQACPLSSVACRRRELNTSLTPQGHQPYYCSLDWVKSRW